MNKKGQIMDMVQYIPKVIVLAGLIFVIYSLITAGIKNEVDVFNSESQLIIQRILYSKSGISYHDSEINKLDISKIDLTKFNDNYLNNMFKIKDDSHFAVKLSLDQEVKDEFVAYVNKDKYELWLPLTARYGVGGKTIQEESFVVQVRNQEGKIKNAMLTIEVILPNA